MPWPGVLLGQQPSAGEASPVDRASSVPNPSTMQSAPTTLESSGGMIGAFDRAISPLFLSQLWMGLSAAAYVFLNAGMLGRELPVGVYWLAGWGTWLVYVLDVMGGHSAEDHVNRPRRTAFFERRGRVVIFALIAGVIPAPWALSGIHWNTSTEILLGVLGLVGIAYVVALLPTRAGLRTLKRTGAIKSLIVTAAWAVGGVGVPLVLGRATGAGPAGPIWAIAAWGTIVLFLDTLLLDHRDRAGDEQSGVRTAATVLRRWTMPVLYGGTLLAGVLWIAAMPSSDPRWPVLGLAWAAWLVPVVFCEYLEKREIRFAVSVSAWRFVGAAAMWWVLVPSG